MLIHIVCWKYKTEVDETARENHRLRLRALKDVIGCIESLEVGADILHLDRSFDSGLVATFADEQGLEDYTLHPEHQKVARYGKDISEKVVSVDFLSANS